MLAALAFTLLAAPMQTSLEPLLKYGIVGSTGDSPVPPNQDPLTLLGKAEIQSVLLRIARKPMPVAPLQESLPKGVTADDLLASGLLKRTGSDFAIAFNLFTQADVETMHRVCANDGEWLADAFVGREGEIEKLLDAYGQHGRFKKQLAYLLVGCFSLDWDGLALSEQMGVRSYNEPHADGGKYVVWAEEIGSVSLKGMYWGSHNTAYGDVVLTSFGDHHSLPRTAFPDLTGRLGSGWKFDGPPELVSALRRVRQDALSDVGRQVGLVMSELREGPVDLSHLGASTSVRSASLQNLMQALVEISYVEETAAGYSSLIPILTLKDREMVMGVRRIGKEIMSEWMKERAPLLEKELASITPLRNGVRYDTAFNQIWHYVFALANRDLVERGFMADPYGPDRKFKGFIPTVWSSNLELMP